MKNILCLVLFLVVTSAFGQEGLDMLVGKDAALPLKKEVKGQPELTGVQQDSVYFFLNKKLPRFILKDLNGKTFSSSDLIGKPALICLWSVHCSPCLLEFPYLDSIDRT